MKRSTALLGLVPALALSLAACGGQNTTDASGESTGGAITADGSSTVGPLTAAAAELYKAENADVNVSVGISGTGGGFKKFCTGETDISNASRPIKDEEKAACAEAGVEFVELNVATDALSVVVSKDNDFVKCLTVEELNTMWAPESEGAVSTWDQVNASFPAEPIELFGPGTDSGTFDYFTDEINGEEGATRADYTASEDDNVLVSGVSGSKNAIGYFGFTYFEANADKLNAVEIDGGNGCVAPSKEAAADGSYSPLARPLFIYVNKASYNDKPQVASFVDWYVANDGTVAEAADYIALSEEQVAELQAAAATLKG